jgi:hypothetical protein
MPARKLLFVTTLALSLVAPAGAEPEALADAPPFGPIASSTFFFVNGTAIEVPKDTCLNGDVLRIRGPGLGSAAKADVSPRTFTYPNTKNRDKYACEAPDCYQLYVQLTSKDAVATRTVTLTSADGRTIVTKFDVTANAGRCDTPKK